VLGK